MSTNRAWSILSCGLVVAASCTFLGGCNPSSAENPPGSNSLAGSAGQNGSGATAGSGGVTSAATGARNLGGNVATGSGGASNGIGGTTEISNPLTTPADGVAAGNPDGTCAVPAEAGLEDVSSPTKIVGDGTAASCTGDAVVAAVWNEGAAVNRVTFNCGPDPVTITLAKSIQVPNAPSGASTVIDGGGKVTLSGGGKVRILYANACNSDLGWYTDHCQDQDSPHLTVQNLTFIDGNAANIAPSDVDSPSGGAIFMRSGRLKIINSRFFNNRAIAAHSDYGGGAVRVLGQFDDLPVYVVNSTFGGKDGYGNSAANGGALSSIGTSWTIINSLFSYNTAIGTGANDGNGGNGGAIYNDGNLILTNLCGVRMEQNVANEGGGAIFFVSNNETGSLTIEQSLLTANTSKQFETQPGMFVIAKQAPIVTNSTIE